MSRSQRKRCRSPNLRDDRGYATIVAASMMAALLAITVGAVYIDSAVVARHRAQSAADMAALAAATAMTAGSAVACDKASAVARAMGTTLAACAVDDLDVIVTAESPVRLPWGSGAARAVARAGPVE